MAKMGLVFMEQYPQTAQISRLQKKGDYKVDTEEVQKGGNLLIMHDFKCKFSTYNN